LWRVVRPGIFEALEASVGGYKLAIVSNAKGMVEPIAKRSGWRSSST